MKKILIPIFGLLVLILLTPIILAKIANSNIDTKIASLKKQGILIKEVNKNIEYLNSNRIFEVEFNSKTNSKNWNFYKKYIKQAKFKVNLKFKNLPITTAKIDIEIQKIDVLNQEILQGLKLHLITKDFKTINYKFDDYNNGLILTKVNGVYKVAKYDKVLFKAQAINLVNVAQLHDITLNLTIKDLVLGLIDYQCKVDKWKIQYNQLIVKGENSEENLTTHLMPNNKYNFDDKFISEKLALQIQKNYIAFGDINWDLKVNNFTKKSIQNMKINYDLKWDKTEYKKAIVDGGSVDIELIMLKNQPKTLKDIQVKASINLKKSLFNRITSEFDPAIINKYFKNYISNISIKNGEITINGNRI